MKTFKWVAEVQRMDIIPCMRYGCPFRKHLKKDVCMYAYLKRFTHANLMIDNRQFFDEHFLIDKIMRKSDWRQFYKNLYFFYF